MICKNCNTDIPDGSKYCPECGVDNTKTIEKDTLGKGTRDELVRANLVYPKNPPLSPHLCWITILLPGLAHIIFGQVRKGFSIIISTFILVFLTVPLLITPSLVWIVVSIIGVIDSYKVGRKLASGQPVGKWEWFPKS